MFMVGTCFVQAMAQHMTSLDATEQESFRALAFTYWGSIPKAMSSLWMATTGGQDWEVLANPLWEVDPVYYCLFLTFVGFFLFVIANSLTSLFVDSAIQYAERDHHQVIQAQLARKKEYADRIVELYKRMDVDHDGEISEAEFHSHLDDPKMIAFASSLEIDTVDLQQFF